MFETLQIVYQRLFKPQNVEDALRQLLSPGVINRAAGEVTCGGALLENIAEQESFDAGILLDEVALRLELLCVRKLHLPSATLLKKTGYPAETLQKTNAVPQHSLTAPAGYLLAVSDLGHVSVEEYERRGIPVQLALHSQITGVWEEWNRISKNGGGSITEAQLFAIMRRLSIDAAECGAHEVFVGHPDEASYEFLVDAKRYSGRVHPGAYRLLLSYFKDTSRFTHPCAEEEGKELTFALTKNFSKPVVYLTWQHQDKDETPLSDNENRESPVESSPGAAPPLSIAEPRAAEPAHEPLKANGLEVRHKDEASPAKVLLVDDDARFSAILSRILQRNGYAVSVAQDGLAALELLRSGEVQPNVIISDVHMPNIDGAEFLRQLRDTAAQTPILMVTSDEDQLLQVELVELGADAFVRKQDDVRVLLAWCNNLLARRREETEPMAEEFPLPTQQLAGSLSTRRHG